MASLITNVELIGANAAAKYTWSGTAPFTVLADGSAILQDSDQTSIVVLHENDGNTYTQPVPIEVVDSTEDTDDLQQVIHPPKPILQFRGRRTNLYYTVEVYDGVSEWLSGPSVTEDGRGYYQVPISGYTPSLDYQFRITPYDESGTAGDSLQYNVFHLTSPYPPELTYTYASGGGGVVTVDAV